MMLQWPWEDLVYASSCPFKIFQSHLKQSLYHALPVYLMVVVCNYLNCVVLELRVREFSPRWLQHGDGGTVETTCFVEAIDGC